MDFHDQDDYRDYDWREDEEDEEEVFSEAETTPPPALQYTIVGQEDGSKNLTVFRAGEKPLQAHSTHPHFEAIQSGVLAGDHSVLDLFDIALTAGKKLEKLTDRVSVANGYLYFDGDRVENGLSDQVLRFLDEGIDDWKPLVAFFEKVMQNPTENSRTALYDWLQKESLTLTEDGDIVGYKGVDCVRDEDGNALPDQYQSSSTGTAISNGMVFEGKIPNPIGGIVEMPRSEVDDNTGRDCSFGLHVGTWNYASNFAEVTLEVHVNPRDVVSVPRYDTNKMRTCRYKIVQVVEQKYKEPVLYDQPVVEEEPKSEPKKSNGSTIDPEVRPGDVYEDKDKRRERKVKVVDLDGDKAVVVDTVTGKESKVGVNRLVGRYFKRVRRGKKK